MWIRTRPGDDKTRREAREQTASVRGRDRQVDLGRGQLFLGLRRHALVAASAALRPNFSGFAYSLSFSCALLAATKMRGPRAGAQSQTRFE